LVALDHPRLLDHVGKQHNSEIRVLVCEKRLFGDVLRSCPLLCEVTM
jgi:hypothetical protein